MAGFQEKILWEKLFPFVISFLHRLGAEQMLRRTCEVVSLTPTDFSCLLKVKIEI